MRRTTRHAPADQKAGAAMRSATPSTGYHTRRMTRPSLVYYQKRLKPRLYAFLALYI